MLRPPGDHAKDPGLLTPGPGLASRRSPVPSTATTETEPLASVKARRVESGAHAGATPGAEPDSTRLPLPSRRTMTSSEPTTAAGDQSGAGAYAEKLCSESRVSPERAIRPATGAAPPPAAA